MDSKVFRKKSLERLHSPEQMNAYIRVAGAGVWLMMLGLLVLLVGICAWGIWGRMHTTVTIGAMTKNGCTVCYVKEEVRTCLTEDTVVEIDGESYAITHIPQRPEAVDGRMDAYLVHVGGLKTGDWVYEITLDRAHGINGTVYVGEILLESIVPMSFVVN